MTTNPLAAVRHATRARRESIGAYRAAIIQARHAGCTLSAIAEAAGTDSPAVHRIIERHSPPERMTPEDYANSTADTDTGEQTRTANYGNPHT